MDFEVEGFKVSLCGGDSLDWGWARIRELFAAHELDHDLAKRETVEAFLENNPHLKPEDLGALANRKDIETGFTEEQYARISKVAEARRKERSGQLAEVSREAQQVVEQWEDLTLSGPDFVVYGLLAYLADQKAADDHAFSLVVAGITGDVGP